MDYLRLAAANARAEFTGNLMGYDDWKTTPPPMGNGSGDGPRFRCVQCDKSFDAAGTLRHFDETAHVIVGRKGDVQQFSFTPRCQQSQVSLEEVVARR